MCDRDDKTRAYRAVRDQTDLLRTPTGERGSIQSRVDPFLLCGRDGKGIYSDKAVSIQPPKGDDRSLWRDTVMSLGAFPAHRSNRAVDPYSGCYAVLGGTEAQYG